MVGRSAVLCCACQEDEDTGFNAEDEITDEYREALSKENDDFVSNDTDTLHSETSTVRRASLSPLCVCVLSLTPSWTWLRRSLTSRHGRTGT